MLSNEPPAYPGGPAASPPAADAGGPSTVAGWRRLFIRRSAWEAWARAGVLLGIAQRPDLRRSPLTRSASLDVADHMRLAASGAVFAKLIELHDDAFQALLPSGRVPEAPRIAGHRAPEQVRRDAAQEAPPTVPAGAPVNDVAPRAGDLPGTQAVALPPVRAP